MKQFGTKLPGRMALSKAVKGVWPCRLLTGSNESSGLMGLSSVSSLIESLHSVTLRIKRNADSLGSVTNIKIEESSVETTILTTARKSFSE